MANVKKMVGHFLLLTLFYLSQALAANELYPGEKLITVNGFQTLTKFIKGNPKKPLVIFVPGNSHLARIAYGFPSGNPKDFLSYWVQQKGYSFLGISYPLDNAVYTQVYPAFSIDDWGNQIAETARQFIHDHHLSQHIIILGWSMGGSIEEMVNVAAKRKGLTVDLFIGLSAVPPLPYIMQSGTFKIDKMLPNGLADKKIYYHWFVKALNEQNQYNKHVIIPENIYLREFLGSIPIALGAEGYHYQNGKFVYNIEKTLQDGGVFNFVETPWIALIRDDSPSLMNIAYIYPASWHLLRMQMIYQVYFAKKDVSKLSSQQWITLRKMIDTLSNALMVTIHGNHFFFVGEKGARETADNIDKLLAKANHLKNEISKI